MVRGGGVRWGVGAGWGGVWLGVGVGGWWCLCGLGVCVCVGECVRGENARVCARICLCLSARYFV